MSIEKLLTMRVFPKYRDKYCSFIEKITTYMRSNIKQGKTLSIRTLVKVVIRSKGLKVRKSHQVIYKLRGKNVSS